MKAILKSLTHINRSEHVEKRTTFLYVKKYI